MKKLNFRIALSVFLIMQISIFTIKAQSPEYFIKNKNFKYEIQGMNSSAKGKAEVVNISNNQIITLRVQGTSFLSDVRPGDPTEVKFDHNIKIEHRAGNYYYNLAGDEVMGEIGAAQELSFSGEAFLELTPEKQKTNLADMIQRKLSDNVSNYFTRVNLNDLLYDDESKDIVKAFQNLDAMGQIEMLAWTMNGVLSNKDSKVREYVYKELNNINYKSFGFLGRAALNTHFTNFKETDVQLKELVNQLQKKILSGK